MQAEHSIDDDSIIIAEPTQSSTITEIRSLSEIARTVATVDDLLEKLTLSKEEMLRIEQATRGQANNLEWKRLRKGRVTASNFYRVYTKVESLRRKPNTDCSKLVESLLNPPNIGHLPQISRGVQLEQTAVEKLRALLLQQGHSNVNIRECGLFIHPQQPYMGASPDGICSCDCCGDRLVEIKCPTRDIGSLPYLERKNGKVALKRKSLYYGQVQGQMMVTDIKETYFFVFNDESYAIDSINIDEQFCEQLSSNIALFFTQYLAPQLIIGSSKKRKLSE